MNIERMQPADFDAVYRLLTQSFPATERRGAAGSPTRGNRKGWGGATFGAPHHPVLYKLLYVAGSV